MNKISRLDRETRERYSARIITDNSRILKLPKTDGLALKLMVMTQGRNNRALSFAFHVGASYTFVDRYYDMINEIYQYAAMVGCKELNIITFGYKINSACIIKRDEFENSPQLFFPHIAGYDLNQVMFLFDRGKLCWHTPGVKKYFYTVKRRAGINADTPLFIVGDILPTPVIRLEDNPILDETDRNDPSIFFITD